MLTWRYWLQILPYARDIFILVFSPIFSFVFIRVLDIVRSTLQQPPRGERKKRGARSTFGSFIKA